MQESAIKTKSQGTIIWNSQKYMELQKNKKQKPKNLPPELFQHIEEQSQVKRKVHAGSWPVGAGKLVLTRRAIISLDLFFRAWISFHLNPRSTSIHSSMDSGTHQGLKLDSGTVARSWLEKRKAFILIFSGNRQAKFLDQRSPCYCPVIAGYMILPS